MSANGIPHKKLDNHKKRYQDTGYEQQMKLYWTLRLLVDSWGPFILLIPNIPPAWIRHLLGQSLGAASLSARSHYYVL